MKRFIGYGLGAGACLLVSGLLVLQNPHSGHAASGSATVALSGTPSVSITNSPPTISLAPSVRIQPFQFSSESIDIDDGQLEVSETLDVPAGKELVIEYFSAEADLPSSQKLLELTVGTTVGGNTVTHSFIPTLTGFTGGPVPMFGSTIDIFVASSVTRLYSDSGAGSVRLGASRNAASLGGDVTFHLSGFLVNVQ